MQLLDSVPEVVIDDEAALDAARPTVVTTGTVTYELQVQKASGVPAVTEALVDLPVAQA
jgi:hypothetical protein